MNAILNMVRWFIIRLAIVMLVVTGIMVAITVYTATTDSLVLPIGDNAVFVCGEKQIDDMFWNVFVNSSVDNYGNITVQEIGSNCLLLNNLEVRVRDNGLDILIK